MKDSGIAILERNISEKRMVVSLKLDAEFMVNHGKGHFIPNYQYAVIASMVRDSFYGPCFIENFATDFAKKYGLLTVKIDFDIIKSIFLEEREVKISVTLTKVRKYFFELEFIFFSDEEVVFAKGSHRLVVMRESSPGSGFVLVRNLKEKLESQDLRNFLGL
jgi:hypothetical protein